MHDMPQQRSLCGAHRWVSPGVGWGWVLWNAVLPLRLVFAGGLALLLSAAAPPLSSAPDFAGEPATLKGRVLEVASGGNLPRPSDAARIVQPGDIVRIASGHYVDCAVWPSTASPLTIEAAGGAVVIADKTCEDKALFVVKGHAVTVRGLTFTGAKAPAHNGAGIRAEGRHLIVENSYFIDNEEGILGGLFADGTIVVRDSVFRGNGNCVQDCAHGIYVGRIAELRIERTHFFEQHIGHHVKSRAARTELFGNVIEDGSAGSSSYLVDIPDGGTLVMRGNRLEKGPRSDNPGFAITIGEEGLVNTTSEILIEDNEFTNSATNETVFLRNRTAAEAILRGNRLYGRIRPLEGPGVVSVDLPAARQQGTRNLVRFEHPGLAERDKK